jgi:hypothetical protein
MKKRHEEWWKLTSQASPAQYRANVPIRVLDLPGFRRMEDKLLLNPPRQGLLSPEVEDFADNLSKETFGIVRNDTLFELPRAYDELPEWSDERQEIEDKWDAHEEQFQTAEATDDEAIPILLRLGFDFRDQRGQPIRCVKLFARQAEAAAKGIMGKLPDREAAGLESWASALERDARQHMLKKRAG